MLIVGDDAGREVVLHAVDELEHLGELALLVRGDHLQGAEELGGGAAYCGVTHYGSGTLWLWRHLLWLRRHLLWVWRHLLWVWSHLLWVWRHLLWVWRHLLRLYVLRQVAWKGPKSSVVAASKASSLPRIVSIGR